MKLLAWWPFVLESTHEKMRKENTLLKQALHEERRKYLLLIGRLRLQKVEPGGPSCPICGFGIRQVERKPFVIKDDEP
jgi:hypothetical protein